MNYLNQGPGTIRRAIGEFIAALFIFVVVPYVMLLAGLAWGVR